LGCKALDGTVGVVDEVTLPVVETPPDSVTLDDTVLGGASLGRIDDGMTVVLDVDGDETVDTSLLEAVVWGEDTTPVTFTGTAGPSTLTGADTL